MERLLDIMQVFAAHPLLAFVFSMLFMVPCFLPRFNGRQKLVLCTSTLVWLLYGFWEIYMSQLQPAADSIVTRTDHYLLGPFVGFFAVIAAITIISGAVKPSTECEISFNAE